MFLMNGMYQQLVENRDERFRKKTKRLTYISYWTDFEIWWIGSKIEWLKWRDNYWMDMKTKYSHSDKLSKAKKVQIYGLSICSLIGWKRHHNYLINVNNL